MPPHPPPAPSPFPRIAAHICFWLCLFPVLAGAMTIGFIPMRVRHHRTALATAGSESYHQDARRALVTTIVNAVVRIAAIPLLVGFVLASMRESRRLRLVVFISAIALTAVHLLAPIIHAGPMMAIAWFSPLYFLPAAAAVLSGIALWTQRHTQT